MTYDVEHFHQCVLKLQTGRKYLQIKYPTTTKNLIQYTKIVFKIEKLENKQLNFLNGKNTSMHNSVKLTYGC